MMSELTFCRELFLIVIIAVAAGLGAYAGMRVTLAVTIRREQRERAARQAERLAKERRFAEVLRVQREADYAEMQNIEDALTRRVMLGESPLLIDRALFLRYFKVQHGAMPYLEVQRFDQLGDMRFVRRDTGESEPMKLVA